MSECIFSWNTADRENKLFLKELIHDHDSWVLGEFKGMAQIEFLTDINLNQKPLPF